MLDKLGLILSRDQYGAVECHIRWSAGWPPDAPVDEQEDKPGFSVVIEDTVGLTRVEMTDPDLSAALERAVSASRSMPIRVVRTS